MSKLLGFIGEDKSDLATFNEIILKYIPNNSFKIKHFIGNGHGKIASKLMSWCEILSSDGCDFIFIIQDRDDYIYDHLKKTLEDKASSKINRNKFVVVIPTRELEAWLLTNNQVLKNIFNFLTLPTLPTNPELSKDPKKEIAELVRRHRQNQRLVYLNTSHNQEIAKQLSISDLKKCKSFLVLDKFINTNLIPLKRKESQKVNIKKKSKR